jgi:uncharacterized membrane protein YeaQ/YmgE (transglycosylase-associated protein family)
MTLPALLFGFIISTLLGSVFHLLRGGSAGRLLLYLILGWTGFWLGHFLAGQFDWTFVSIGPLHLGPAAIGSLIFLAVGYWLSLNDAGKK